MNYYEKCKRNCGNVTNQQYLEWLEKQLKPTITLKYDKPAMHGYDCVRLAVNGNEWNLITTVNGIKALSEEDVREISYIYGDK